MRYLSNKDILSLIHKNFLVAVLYAIANIFIANTFINKHILITNLYLTLIGLLIFGYLIISNLREVYILLMEIKNRSKLPIIINTVIPAPINNIIEKLQKQEKAVLTLGIVNILLMHLIGTKFISLFILGWNLCDFFIINAQYKKILFKPQELIMCELAKQKKKTE